MGRSARTKKTRLAGGYEPDGACCIKGCSEPLWGHEFCRRHYQAWRNNGHPLHLVTRVARPTAKTATREYKSWWAARKRCTNPEARQWSDYGGRGITMCERWCASFEAFLADVGPSPSRQHTLGRIDNDGPYAPHNVRWETMTEQNRNTRATVLTAEKVAMAKRRHLDGERIADLAREIGVKNITLWQAIKGVSWADVVPAGSA